MKRILLFAMLLGLTGCGDSNQSDAAQFNVQVNTLQKAEATPALANYRLATSPQTMRAVAPLQGWNVTKSTVMGASTLIDAAKDTKISAALITPNAKQVAEVLRGGAAGIALTIAVDQLLGAVDWVMDPANNQIRYKPKPKVGEPPEGKYLWKVATNEYAQTYAYSASESCKKWASIIGQFYYDKPAHFVRVEDIKEAPNYSDAYGYCITYPEGYRKEHKVYITGTLVDINAPKEKTLPLEAVAEQVISNADAGSLDAQVATNLAAQNILNDVAQAELVVQELENNASEKCDQNTNPSCKKECDPPAGVKFNKVTHFERHGRDPDINVGSHGCMAKTGSPVHWHYDVNHQLPDGRCFLKGHNFGGCGVAP
ncbi:hypothetical protein [Acinetobacter sp. YK3]|uniref:hypothetical protein n=1 Tax=Acinetobacter sp. YK3 TaxID=1860097 RepID=UPI00084C2E25|nr:hypothetical protein [Acinetobacter sp. YK3]OEC84800.1 hypothetical protein A9Z07_13395 [Acinetobacter sp. YK3]